jgi:hypothetical protein
MPLACPQNCHCSEWLQFTQLGTKLSGYFASKGYCKPPGPELKCFAEPAERSLLVSAGDTSSVAAPLPHPKCQVEEALHIFVSSFIGSFVIKLL